MQGSTLLFGLTALWFVMGSMAYGKLFGLSQTGQMVGFAPVEWALVADVLMVLTIWRWGSGD